jgi:hypothetical protein
MNQTFANITKMVYDFLLVEITEPAFCNQNHYFDYSILSQDEKPVRKGRFFGSNVQLRISQMEEGKYFLNLFLDGNICQHFSFEKKSSAAFAGI